MGRVAGSRPHIEELLTELEAQYGSFPVNQTTVSLPATQFDRVRANRTPHCIDAYVEVRNDDSEVLHVQDDGAMHLPGDAISTDEAIEKQVTDTVASMTGIDCTVTAIGSATIAGLRNEDDPTLDTQYHLIVVFNALYRGGTVEADADWKQEPARLDAVFA